MMWEVGPLAEISTRLKSAGIESTVFDPWGGMPEQGDFLSALRHNLANLRRVYEKQ